MKPLHYNIQGLMILLIACMHSLGVAQVKIGDNTTTMNSSSLLEMESTDKGLLIPRMTEAQRTAIGTPSTGLMVFQTDLPSGFYFYNGTAWEIMHADTSNTHMANKGLNVVGKGAGSTKTTTVVIDNIVAEQFGNNDELYFDISGFTDYADGDVSINLIFMTMGAETGKIVRWNAIYKLHIEGTSVSGTTGILDSGDLAVDPGQYEQQETAFMIPEATLAGVESIHFRIKRIATAGGTAPSAGPAVLHVNVQYNATR
ncbi:hypothetical protein [Changchengzhania lutea]|uniref:hypothetical protein n=1 Tax=Changchengzhania lutea TaxID=2049305 RepID=UPI00115DC804|nr:hypothetical protein [Changchengzhania lutea]